MPRRLGSCWPSLNLSLGSWPSAHCSWHVLHPWSPLSSAPHPTPWPTLGKAAVASPLQPSHKEDIASPGQCCSWTGRGAHWVGFPGLCVSSAPFPCSKLGSWKPWDHFPTKTVSWLRTEIFADKPCGVGEKRGMDEPRVQPWRVSLSNYLYLHWKKEKKKTKPTLWAELKWGLKIPPVCHMHLSAKAAESSKGKVGRCLRCIHAI